VMPMKCGFHQNQKAEVKKLISTIEGLKG